MAARMEFDMEWTGWNADKYPNGVQDLPVKIKEKVRKGGEFKVHLKGAQKTTTIRWKASFDLAFMQLAIGESKGPYDNALGISQITSIVKRPITVTAKELKDMKGYISGP